MNPEWSIQSRSDACSATGAPFQEGEYFYTLLFDEKTGFRREDLCEAAFTGRGSNLTEPFSFWRAKYEPPPAAAPEPLEKQSAEDLLRRYLSEGASSHANVVFILALMLERKRILKEVETRRAADGSLIRIYEHTKSGEVFLIPDPQLRLDQIAGVQAEVVGQLAG